MNKDDNLTGITYSALKNLMLQPGRIYIHIHKLKGYYVPFVMHTDDAEITGHGPIITDGQAAAGRNREEVIDALKESLGPNIEIFYPGMEPVAAPGGAPLPTTLLH